MSLPIRRPVQTYIEYTGTTKAIETVDLRARVKGFLQERPFREGADVKKGDLLFVIDEIPFQDPARPGQGEAGRGRGGAQEGRGIEGQGGGQGPARPRPGRLSAGPGRGESHRRAAAAERRVAGRSRQGRGRPEEVRGAGGGRPGQPRAGRGRLRDQHADRAGQRGPGRGRGPQCRDRPRLLPHHRPVRRPDQPGPATTRGTSWATARPPCWPRSSGPTPSTLT